MKLTRHLTLTVSLLFFGGFAHAQHDIHAGHNHAFENLRFEKIDRAVKTGTLTYSDGLVKKVLLVTQPERVEAEFVPETRIFTKCAVPLNLEIEEATKSGILSSQQLETISEALKPSTNPTTMAVYVSPLGKFEFTYETTGTDAVPTADANGNNIPDFVERAAWAADSSWKHQVTRLNYADPIPVQGTYKISFKEKPGGMTDVYGVTISSGGTSRIEVHRNFVGFPPNTHPDGLALGALYATIAHEFKHAVQYAYGNKINGSLYEVDATLYEEVVFDDVNDYYNYLGSGSIFTNPGSAPTALGYGQITWALFYRDKFGAGFWPQVWNTYATQSITYITAINNVINSLGSSQKISLAENHLWHIATGDSTKNTSRLQRNFGFEERNFYPVSSATNLSGMMGAASSSFSISANTGRHIVLTPAASDTGNVFFRFTYSNNFVAGAILAELKDKTNRVFFLEPENGTTSMERRLPVRWEDIRRVMAVITNAATTGNAVTYEISNRSDIAVETEPSQKTFSFAVHPNYPNPFNPTTVIPFEINRTGRIRLSVWDISGRKISTLADGVFAPGLHSVTWNAHGVSSGMYLVRLESTSGVITRKMMLVK